MTIVSIVHSYRIAPAEILEKLVVPSAELKDVLARLRAEPAIDEVVLLSTCNRVELYAVTQGPVEPVTRAVADLMAARGRIPADEFLRMVRIHVGATAASHLFSVARGLDSMAVGEDQIIAQIEAAVRAAARRGPSAPSSPLGGAFYGGQVRACSG
jgi:glutamyl-tRNA reductase